MIFSETEVRFINDEIGYGFYCIKKSRLLYRDSISLCDLAGTRNTFVIIGYT